MSFFVDIMSNRYTIVDIRNKTRIKKMVYLINNKEVKEVKETNGTLIQQLVASGWHLTIHAPQWYLATKGNLGRAF